MEFTVSSSVLHRHLSIVNRVVTGKSTLPILDYFLFSVDEGKLRLMGSDLETTITTTLPLNDMMAAGQVGVPARLLISTLKEFPDMLLHFKVDDSTHSISVEYEANSRKGAFDLVGADAEEFPQLPEVGKGQKTEIEITTDILVQGLANTLFSMGTSNLTAHLFGVLLEAKQEHLRFVATDSSRISCYTRTDVHPDGVMSVLLPGRPAQMLGSVFGKAGDPLKIAFDEHNLVFTTDTVQVICRLTEAHFPDYESVFPKNNNFKLLVDRELLHNAIRQVSPFSNQGTNLVALEMHNDQLTVRSNNFENRNRAFQTIPCEYDGEERTVGFRTLFLTELLQVISSQEVVFYLAENVQSSVLVRPTVNPSEAEDLLMIVMPSSLDSYGYNAYATDEEEQG